MKKEHGVHNHVYDPYNRSEEHNRAVIHHFEKKLADSVTAANVLNVIQHEHHRRGVIETAHKYLKTGGKAHFDVYEGDRSGKGKETSKGYQNNKPAKDYEHEIKKVFPHVERKGTLLIATKH